MNKLSLGCVTFGREIDQRQSFLIMDYAVEQGICFFDTAAVYGMGASETIIGNWLHAHPLLEKNITVATKITPPYDAQSLKYRIESSLQRLRRSQIDVLFFHNWHPSVLNPEMLAIVASFMKQGIIKTLGASNFTAPQLKQLLVAQAACKCPLIRCVQNNNNVAVSDLNKAFLKTCEKHKINIITYSPLGAGFLTGKHAYAVEQGSRFERMPAHQQIYFTKESVARLQQLQALAKKEKCSPVHIALAWALYYPGISRVLIGAREVKHIQQAIDALAYKNQPLLHQLSRLL